MITRFPFKIGKKQDEKLRDITFQKRKVRLFVLSVLFEKRFFAEIVLVAFLFCPFFLWLFSKSSFCSPVCFMLRKKRKKNKSRMKNYGITRSKKEKSTDNTFQKSWKLKCKNIWALCWNYSNSFSRVGTKKLLLNNHQKKRQKKRQQVAIWAKNLFSKRLDNTKNVVLSSALFWLNWAKKTLKKV